MKEEGEKRTSKEEGNKWMVFIFFKCLILILLNAACYVLILLNI